MDLASVIQSEVSQKEKNKYGMLTHIYGCKKKMVQMKLLTKQKYSHRCRKQTYGYKGGRRGGINWEIGIDIYTLLYVK